MQTAAVALKVARGEVTHVSRGAKGILKEASMILRLISLARKVSVEPMAVRRATSWVIVWACCIHVAGGGGGGYVGLVVLPVWG